MIQRNLDKEEKYVLRRLMLTRHQLDRDLCQTELEIREFVADKAEKYLAIPN